MIPKSATSTIGNQSMSLPPLSGATVSGVTAVTGVVSGVVTGVVTGVTVSGGVVEIGRAHV